MTKFVRNTYTARVKPSNAPVTVKGGTLTLDDAAIPHVSGSLVLSGTTAETLDPRTGARLEVIAKREDGTATFTPWAEQRRNQAANPRPVSYGGSGWQAPGGLGAIAEPGWIGGTLSATTTPYIFASASTRAYAAGEKVTLRIRYRVTGQAGAAQYIGVIPHVRAGNAYYRGQHVTRPIVIGQEEDVKIQWTTPVAIAAGNLDLAIVGSNASGSGLATADAGFGIRATRILIEDGWTDGEFFDGATSPAGSTERTRWVGTANASASVFEARTLTGMSWAVTAERTFDLGVRAVETDKASGQVTVDLASDEALLSDYAPLEDDYPGIGAVTVMLRDVVNRVLSAAIPGTSLETSPATNADITPRYAAQNRVLNPRAESTFGYVAGTNCNLVSTGSSTPYEGAAYVTWRSAAAGDCNMLIWTDNQVRPGDWLYAEARVRTGTAGRQMRLTLRFRDGEGNTITERTETIAAATGGSWSHVFVAGRAPAGAQFVSLVATGVAAAGNETFAIDVPLLNDGDEPAGWFHGGMPADANYQYSWAGPVNGSVSIRTPHDEVERSRESIIWPAGVSAMDFLSPLLKANGLRLVCDERRDWTIRDASYLFEGSGPQYWIPGENIVGQTDRLSRDDDGWYEAFVYEYEWKDRDGIQQSAIDSWGSTASPSKTMREQLANTPFPGRGRAEMAVRRAQQRGKVVTMSGVPTWFEGANQRVFDRTTVDQQQIGVSSSVRFSLDDDTVQVAVRLAPAGA